MRCSFVCFRERCVANVNLEYACTSASVYVRRSIFWISLTFSCDHQEMRARVRYRIKSQNYVDTTMLQFALLLMQPAFGCLYIQYAHSGWRRGPLKRLFDAICVIQVRRRVYFSFDVDNNYISGGRIDFIPPMCFCIFSIKFAFAGFLHFNHMAVF